MQDKALIIFARKPELGKVKTRLAASIGAEKALAIYMRLLEHTRIVARHVSCVTHVFLTEEGNDIFWEEFEQHLQHGTDLGARMMAAFETLFSTGYKRVIIIGSDCPHLDESLAEQGFKWLLKRDVVIGPARDGGYYLLGMNKIHEALFRNKNWSTANVFSQTKADIDKFALSCYLLPTLSDVDEAEDVPSEWM